MEFKDKLNEYITLLNCSAHDLADASGLTAATISRYRSGERIPQPSSSELSKLAQGISLISSRNSQYKIAVQSALSALSDCIINNNSTDDNFCVNMNALISALSINVNALAKSLNYDPSYISRIKNGHRKPSKPEKFTNELVEYLMKKYSSDESKKIIAKLIGIDSKTIENDFDYYNALVKWLHSSHDMQDDSLTNFLKKMDEFDLNDYIRAIHFDELKVPTSPFKLPTSKSYYGLKEMMTGELDFLKATVLSKSKEDVILYSDMPMEEMAKEIDFSKKWMLGMAMMLKKGLHLHQIHYMNRPFNEMMLGLESWIPMYMTGQISPYVLKGNQNNAFNHFLRVSGNVALDGEAISGYADNGKYYLTNSKEEVKYYKTRGENLIRKASPLMTIYRENFADEFEVFMAQSAKSTSTKKTIHSSLPLYTISDDLLDEILNNNGVSSVDKEIIFAHLNTLRCDLDYKLKSSTVIDEIPVISEEEFDSFPMSMSLCDLFYEKNILYTYEEYRHHIELSKEYEDIHEKYNIIQSNSPAFRNIRITIIKGESVLISKNKSPIIHFVIQYPKLREALEKYIPPIVD